MNSPKNVRADAKIPTWRRPAPALATGALLLGGALGTLHGCADNPELNSVPGSQSGGTPSASTGGATSMAGTSVSPPGSGGSSGIVVPVAGSGGVATGPCMGLECQIPTDCGAATTTITGTVYTPAGTLPLYNVMVYVPNAELAPLTEGASCVTCDASISGEPVVTAITDTQGRFVLSGAPAGANIPLVMQVGKWRRQVTIPTVSPCVENALTDASLTRLPANQSEGNLPRIALSTGDQDALECLLRKIGISDSEFTNPDGPGRVNLFTGHDGTATYDAALNAGATFGTSPTALWGDVASLARYDVALLACEGGEFPDEKPEDARQAIFDYANLGGRLFLSHWHKLWLERGPDPFPDVVEFNDRDDDLNITADIATDFPKGQALAQWLINVQGSTELGRVDLLEAQNTAASENPMYAQRWIFDPMDAETGELSVKYLTANTPLGVPAASQCGRVVYSDIHVSSGDESGPDTPFPTGCTSTGLSPQEKVLIFMLFDLSACLIPDDEIPEAPDPE